MKILLVMLIGFFPLISIANETDCTFELPIDIKEEALCLTTQVLKKTSCISNYGFESELIELEDRWIYSSDDLNPNKNQACKKSELGVCKNNGNIIYNITEEECKETLD